MDDVGHQQAYQIVNEINIVCKLLLIKCNFTAQLVVAFLPVHIYYVAACVIKTVVQE